MTLVFAPLDYSVLLIVEITFFDNLFASRGTMVDIFVSITSLRVVLCWLSPFL